MGSWLAGGPIQSVFETGPDWTEIASAIAAVTGVLATVAIFWIRNRKKM